ncbi:MAG TPA: cytochrome c [Sphingomicrobium sp.]
MRYWISAALLLAACQQSKQLAYEGADSKTEAAKIEHGKRLTYILDCTGCHGENFEGTDMADKPEDGAMYAPNVTLLVGGYSDAELERLIRRGVPKDGRELWFMPVESFQFLGDQDLASIIAYLRTLKPSGKALPPFKINKVEQKDVDSGVLGNAQAQIRKYHADQPVEMGHQYARGRYIAQTACTGCHNNALQGWPDFTPDLDIAGAYSKPELVQLLTNGQGKQGKDVGPMSQIARRNFAKLTAGEREAVVDYVLARANRPQP